MFKHHIIVIKIFDKARTLHLSFIKNYITKTRLNKTL